MLQETTVTKQWQALSCLVFCATTQLAQQWQRETCKEDLCLADFGTRCSDDDVELLSAMGAVLSSLCTRQFNSSRSQERSSHLENFARFWQSNGNLRDKLKHHFYSVNPAHLWIYLIYYIHLYSVLGMMQWWGMIHDCSTFHVRNQKSIIDSLIRTRSLETHDPQFSPPSFCQRVIGRPKETQENSQQIQGKEPGLPMQ